MLRRLRGQDARGGVAAKVFVVLVAAAVIAGSAPVLVPAIDWLVRSLR